MHNKICALTVMLLLLTVPVKADAAEAEGSIRVYPGGGGEFPVGGEVWLYRVGEPTEGGYRMTDGLAEWTVWQADAESETVRNWALEHLPDARQEREVTVEGAFFDGLEDGLYLIRHAEAPEGYDRFASYLLALPQGEIRRVISEPVVRPLQPSPRTGDHPAPIIGAMGMVLSAVLITVLLEKRNK